MRIDENCDGPKQSMLKSVNHGHVLIIILGLIAFLIIK